MFASSLGFRIVVNLISRGGEEEKTFSVFFSPTAGFHSQILTYIFYSVKTHCKMCIGLTYFFAPHLNVILKKKVVTDDMFSELGLSGHLA